MCDEAFQECLCVTRAGGTRTLRCPALDSQQGPSKISGTVGPPGLRPPFKEELSVTGYLSPFSPSERGESFSKSSSDSNLSPYAAQLAET